MEPPYWVPEVRLAYGGDFFMEFNLKAEQNNGNLAIPLSLEDVANGVEINPYRLVRAIIRQGEVDFRRTKDAQRIEQANQNVKPIPSWAARFGQIQNGEQHERVSKVLGFKQIKDDGQHYYSNTAHMTSVIYNRNQELHTAWVLQNANLALPDQLAFLRPTVMNKADIEDFLALGLYAINQQRQSDGLNLDLSTYHNAVRASIARLEHQGEKAVPFVIDTLGTVMENTLFPDLGVELKQL